MKSLIFIYFYFYIYYFCVFTVQSLDYTTEIIRDYEINKAPLKIEDVATEYDEFVDKSRTRIHGYSDFTHKYNITTDPMKTGLLVFPIKENHENEIKPRYSNPSEDTKNFQINKDPAEEEKHDVVNNPKREKLMEKYFEDALDENMNKNFNGLVNRKGKFVIKSNKDAKNNVETQTYDENSSESISRYELKQNTLKLDAKKPHRSRKEDNSDPKIREIISHNGKSELGDKALTSKNRYAQSNKYSSQPLKLKYKRVRKNNYGNKIQRNEYRKHKLESTLANPKKVNPQHVANFETSTKDLEKNHDLIDNNSKPDLKEAENLNNRHISSYKGTKNSREKLRHKNRAPKNQKCYMKSDDTDQKNEHIRQKILNINTGKDKHSNNAKKLLSNRKKNSVNIPENTSADIGYSESKNESQDKSKVLHDVKLRHGKKLPKHVRRIKQFPTFSLRKLSDLKQNRRSIYNGTKRNIGRSYNYTPPKRYRRPIKYVATKTRNILDRLNHLKNKYNNSSQKKINSSG